MTSHSSWAFTFKWDVVFKFFLDSCLIAQLVCEWVTNLLAIWCLRHLSFESCIQQRKTTGLFSIRKLLACARDSKLKQQTYVAKSRCIIQLAVKSIGLNTHSSYEWAGTVFCFILNSSTALWVGIQFADDLVSQTSQLRILHLAEEDNLSLLSLNLLSCARASTFATNL